MGWGHGWAFGMRHVGEGILEEVLFELRSDEEERCMFLLRGLRENWAGLTGAQWRVWEDEDGEQSRARLRRVFQPLRNLREGRKPRSGGRFSFESDCFGNGAGSRWGQGGPLGAAAAAQVGTQVH